MNYRKEEIACDMFILLSTYVHTHYFYSSKGTGSIHTQPCFMWLCGHMSYGLKNIWCKIKYFIIT